jgi:hypothetical protein
MKVRAIVSMLLALAVPGAGHVYLGRRARGIAFFCIVLFMFAIGLAIDGGLYTILNSRKAPLRLLSTYASMGSGLLYAAAHALGFTGKVAAQTFEYGVTFTLTAGLMNLLLMVDCWDIAHGRKP